MWILLYITFIKLLQECDNYDNFIPELKFKNEERSHFIFHIIIDSEIKTLEILRSQLRSSKVKVGKNEPILVNTPDNLYKGKILEDTASIAYVKYDGLITGYFSYNNISYRIEPALELSVTNSNNEHIVMKASEMKGIEGTCGNIDYNDLSIQNSRKSRGYVITQDIEFPVYKISAIVPFDLYNDSIYGMQNFTLVMQWVFQTFNEILYHYRDTNITPTLYYTEIWTDNIHYPDVYSELTIGQVLDIVDNHRLNQLFPSNSAYDATLLFSPYTYNGTLGLAWLGNVCNPRFGACWARVGDSRRLFSGVSSHELGHVLGLVHDIDNCVCGDGNFCIMNAGYGGSNYLNEAFSNCSKVDLERIISNKNLCLYNELPGYPQNEFCGNRILSNNEQCDCGDELQCIQSGYNTCCNHTSCNFMPGFECCDGECCNNGKISKGNICRYSNNICIEDTLCDGKSNRCPLIDRYKPFGSQCGVDNEGRCLEEKCVSRDDECKNIWNIRSNEADKKCLENNKIGNETGNCGSIGDEYIKCNSKNFECGKLYCTDIEDKNQEGYTGSYIDGVCGVAIPRSINTPISVGMVPDFSYCGNKKSNVCYNQICSKIGDARNNYFEKICGKEAKLISKDNCVCNPSYEVSEGFCYKDKLLNKIPKFSVAILVALLPLYISISLVIVSVLSALDIKTVSFN